MSTSLTRSSMNTKTNWMKTRKNNPMKRTKRNNTKKKKKRRTKNKTTMRRKTMKSNQRRRTMKSNRKRMMNCYKTTRKKRMSSSSCDVDNS